MQGALESLRVRVYNNRREITWKGCVRMRASTRKLVISALLVTLDVLFTRILALNTPVMKLGLGFAAVAFCAQAYGAGWAALTAALGDLLGSLLFPTGAYFPGFTLTAAMTGAIFGLCLYGRAPRFICALAAAALNCMCVSFLANTGLIALITGAAYLPLLAARGVQLAVMLPVQCAVIWLIMRAAPVRALLEKLRESP